jgi:predicted CopG family antitoxin
MKENKITIKLTAKEINTLKFAFDLLEKESIEITEDVKEAVNSFKNQLKNSIDEFAEFLANLYSEHHKNLEELGIAGTTKLAEVILIHSDKVIEELQKY